MSYAINTHFSARLQLRAEVPKAPIHVATPWRTCRKREVLHSAQKQQCRSKKLKIECKSTARTPFPDAQPTDKEIHERVDKAATLLNKMMEEVHEEAFVNTAVAEVTGDSPEVTEDQAIRNAVASKIEHLDEAFLAALNAYIQAAEQQRSNDLVVRLSKIQQEILAQVAERLPPEMRVLDLCLRLLTREERMDVLKESCTGNGKKVPACGLTALRSNSAQLVSDMEDRDYIPDRRLLARMVILREEVAAMSSTLRPHDQVGAYEDVYKNNMMLHTQQVPGNTGHFLKEIMTVGLRAKRKALLQQAFNDEFQINPGSHKTKRKSLQSQQRRPKSMLIRPGAFLTCLAAMQIEMTGDAIMRDKDAQLKRIEEIRQETLEVLEDMAD